MTLSTSHDCGVGRDGVRREPKRTEEKDLSRVLRAIYILIMRITDPTGGDQQAESSLLLSASSFFVFSMGDQRRVNKVVRIQDAKKKSGGPEEDSLKK